MWVEENFGSEERTKPKIFQTKIRGHNQKGKRSDWLLRQAKGFQSFGDWYQRELTQRRPLWKNDIETGEKKVKIQVDKKKKSKPK